MAPINLFYVLPVLGVLLLFQIGLERPQRYVLRNIYGNIDRSSSSSSSEILAAVKLQSRTKVATWLQQEQHQEGKLCSLEQVIKGRWIPITLERPPYIPLSPRVRCLRPEDFYKPFSTYQWRPNECSLAEWNPRNFCRLLSNRTIAFIGDSLTLEHYASLVHMLGDRARLPPKAVQHGQILRHICAGSHCVDVVFHTDFFLTNITEEMGDSFPTVLVLNRGAHFKSDQALQSSLEENTLPDLVQWNVKCKELSSTTSNIQCLLIWRTTVPGHPYCHNFSRPSATVEEMQRWIETTSIKDPDGPYKKGEFHWQDFQRQNELITQLLQRWEANLSDIRIHIMDSYRTNILRPDNHRSHMNDCLHTCSPGGGSDLNSQWLFHLLVLQRQQLHEALLSKG